MEGNRRIVIFEPGAILSNTHVGEIQRRPSIPHVVYAVRKDQISAGEGLVGPNIVGGQWQREYTIREESLPVKPNEDWYIIDEDGSEVKIEGIAEKTSGPWARDLVITCVRTNTERRNERCG